MNETNKTDIKDKIDKIKRTLMILFNILFLIFILSSAYNVLIVKLPRLLIHSPNSKEEVINFQSMLMLYMYHVVFLRSTIKHIITPFLYLTLQGNTDIPDYIETDNTYEDLSKPTDTQIYNEPPKNKFEMLYKNEMGHVLIKDTDRDKFINKVMKDKLIKAIIYMTPIVKIMSDTTLATSYFDTLLFLFIGIVCVRAIYLYTNEAINEELKENGITTKFINKIKNDLLNHERKETFDEFYVHSLKKELIVPRIKYDLKKNSRVYDFLSFTSAVNIFLLILFTALVFYKTVILKSNANMEINNIILMLIKSNANVEINNIITMLKVIIQISEVRLIFYSLYLINPLIEEVEECKKSAISEYGNIMNIKYKLSLKDCIVYK